MQYDYIIELLNLQDNSLVITKLELTNNTYFIHLYSNTTTHCCKNCGSTSLKKHANYIRNIK